MEVKAILRIACSSQKLFFFKLFRLNRDSDGLRYNAVASGPGQTSGRDQDQMAADSGQDDFEGGEGRLEVDEQSLISMTCTMIIEPRQFKTSRVGFKACLMITVRIDFIFLC